MAGINKRGNTSETVMEAMLDLVPPINAGGSKMVVDLDIPSVSIRCQKPLSVLI